MKTKPLHIPRPDFPPQMQLTARELNDARLTDRRTRLTPKRLRDMASKTRR